MFSHHDSTHGSEPPGAPEVLRYQSSDEPRWMKALKRIGPLVRVVRWARGRLRQVRGRHRIFTEYYRDNYWKDRESLSGPGSSLGTTASIRAALPELFARHGIERLLDLPCGDFHWMSHLEHRLELYIGGDIVEPLVQENRERHGAPGREFWVIDSIEDPLPDADLLLCRDLLQHLSHRDIGRFFGNVAASGIPLLLVTDFVGDLPYRDVTTGGWRPVRLTAPPFCFPEPLETIVEGRPDWAEDGGVVKQLSLWRVADLPPVRAFRP